jgi:hypothetical protein
MAGWSEGGWKNGGGERSGRKRFITGRNGRGSWERQGITAFCTRQWIDWLIDSSVWPRNCREIRILCLRRDNLTLSNPIFLPTAYSPALICFGRERGWWITCNYPTVLKEKNMEKQKEYNLCYLFAKVRASWGKVSDKLQQRANKRNKNRVGHLPTSEQNCKIILSDEVRCRIGKG